MNYNKYKIKKNMWSLKGDYRAYDEHDNELYHVEGQALSFNSKFRFLNSKGEELFKIRRKVFTFKPTFYISNDDQDILKIVKTFSFKPKIFVEYLAEQDAFYIEGNIWGNEFKFYKDSREFAYVTKDIWKMTDIYGVAVEEQEGESLILAVVVIINIIKDLEQAS